MILIVTELYYPEETSTGYILTKIAEGLAENFAVQVITGPPDYSGVKAAPRSEIRNKVSIERANAINLNKNKIFSRFLRSVLLSFKLTVKTIKMAKKGDTLFVVTNPAPLLILMCLISRLLQTKLVILIHDVFPENLQAANLLQKDTFLFRILVRLFNAIYKTADHIVVIGRDMKEIMIKKMGENSPKISVIPNWSDILDIRPTDRSSNKIIKDLQLEKRFIVQFAGNIGRVQGIEQMLGAANILKNENVSFLFIGSGAKKNWLIQQTKLLKLTNIIFLDSMPRIEQENFLNACDVGLVSLASGMTGLGVPSKTYNILAAGKPIIAIVDAKSEIGLLVQEEKLGWIVPPADPEQLALTIRAASKSTELHEMGSRSREIAELQYSLEATMTKYRNVFSGLEPRK